MKKEIEVILLSQAEVFLDNIEEPVRKKFLLSMRKTKSRIFGDWFQKMKSTNDIFEFRVDNNGKYYRLFSFWDTRGSKHTLIVCTHGLIKKTNKTPISDIQKAEEIRDKYFKGIL
jgi:phage-related protein